jgi:hypothetical protein
MGAGASTEFNAEAALGDGGGGAADPLADEGYDSDLASDLKALTSKRQKPPRGTPSLDPSRGRLSADPATGGAANALPCSAAIFAPAQYTSPPDAASAPDDTLKLEFVHGQGLK